MVGPVCVLQVPDRPLLARQEVFDLQPRGGIAARLRAEARRDLESTVGHGVVPRAQSGPVPEALLPATLLERRTQKVRSPAGMRNPLQKYPTQNTSSAVTMAMMETPCSHTICQKS